MNIEKLKTVWQSGANAPTTAETEQLKTRFVRNLRSRQRVFIGFLAWVFSALSFCTGLFLYNIFVTHKVNLEKEWAIVLALAALWILTIQFLAQFHRHAQAHRDHENSIVSTLRATLSENQMARTRARRIGLMYLLGIPALALAIHQLRQGEKMNGQEIVSMLVVFGIALIISGGWTCFHYYRQLVPRKSEIESLLCHYESAEDQK